MKIGMVTDSLGSLSFEQMLDAAAELGLDCIEFATGNWSTAPHIDLEALLRSKVARDRFTAAVRDHDLTISALNCNGNSLHPGKSGRDSRQGHPQDDRACADAWRRSRGSDVGLPGRAGRQAPELDHGGLAAGNHRDPRMAMEGGADSLLARARRASPERKGIRHLCLELHGGQNVYNVATLHAAARRLWRGRRRQLRSKPPDVDGRRSGCGGRGAGAGDLPCPRQGHAHRSAQRRPQQPHRDAAERPRRRSARGTT